MGVWKELLLKDKYLARCTAQILQGRENEQLTQHTDSLHARKKKDNSKNSERQSCLQEFFCRIIVEYVPALKVYETRQGLSERLLRRRLERQGWSVWRGGSLHLVQRDDLYPRVRDRYELLCRLVSEKYNTGMVELLQYFCAVQHGMPDFLCYRNGIFKFVECKLGYECLSARQVFCIQRLHDLGFTVEVHKIAAPTTHARRVVLNLVTGTKQVQEEERCLRKYCGKKK